MPGKRTIVVVFLLALILFITLNCLYVYSLPYAVSLLIEKYARDAGIQEFRCQVKAIGLTRMAIGPLSIGITGQPAVYIDDISAEYFPTDLMVKRVRQIQVSGLTIRGEYRDGQFSMPGIDLHSFSPAQSKEGQAPPSFLDSALLDSIDEVSVRNALSDVVVNGTRYIFPLEISVTRERGTPHVLRVSIRIDPCRQRLVVNANLDVTEKRVDVDLRADSMQLGSLCAASVFVPGAMVSGNASLQAHASCALFPFIVSSSNASLTVRDARLTYAGMSISGSDSEMRLDIVGTGGTVWKLTVSPVSISAPIPATLSDAACELQATNAGIEVTGQFAVTLRKTPEDTRSPCAVLAPIHTTGQFTAAYADDGGWKGSALLRADTAHLGIDTVRITLPEFFLTGDVAGSDSTVRFDGAVELRKAMLFDSSLSIRVEDINASIPIAWPCETWGKTGAVSLNAFHWTGSNLASAQATVRQKGMGLFFEGTGKGICMPDLNIGFSGEAGFSGTDGLTAKATYTIKKPGGGPDVDTGRIVKEGAGIVVNGSVEATGDFSFDARGAICTLDSKVRGGMLRIAEKTISLEGIDAGLRFPNVLALKSAPSQRLTVTKASVGEMSLQDVSLDYQVESVESLLIEKCTFRWCDGKVYTQATRIVPGGDEYEVMLYCDQLKLSKLFEQCGAAYMKGEGTLSGRIPLTVKNGTPRIDDGFLFSVPGEGGTIQIKDTDKLSLAIPRDVPQFAQIEIAREALKDFNYDWVKLRLLSEGEDLLLKAQLYGKPASALPFVYQKDLGGFARIESGEGGSHFQGIQLDVNFRLPLDALVKY
jgi:hypothetical protein